MSAFDSFVLSRRSREGARLMNTFVRIVAKYTVGCNGKDGDSKKCIVYPSDISLDIHFHGFKYGMLVLRYSKL